ncbi:putative glutamine amidotransferase [Neobacillus niacini]|uniref:gamma-glutamyl-gamma-aminobutyrate hydrolase family protein n=1 Tax=Neobacillus driksii TaxID=3035913 RepID=UPI00277E87EA|nr:gamma-glutamyl-gamma-aminobutyrate hydrolase family protein [Neobacillus niacini]MDQ0971273.1 putative glutamine amidotransferase [Neobacillus niacini]
MKPIIGVTAPIIQGKITLNQDNINSILMSGGIPYILPYTKDQSTIESVIGHIDGLLLSGGVDIDPTLFGEEPIPGLGEIMPERDELETLLIQNALKVNLPILAICRGIQMLNVAAGGNMFQDIYSQKSDLLQHSQRAPQTHLSHFVTTKEESLLRTITGLDKFKVNSFHHQAVKDPAPGFIISDISSDSVVEAIESIEHKFVLGVQWHPEFLTPFDQVSNRIFTSFIKASKVL